MVIFGVIQPVFEQYEAESPQKTSDVCVKIFKIQPACVAAPFLFLKKRIQFKNHDEDQTKNYEEVCA